MIILLKKKSYFKDTYVELTEPILESFFQNGSRLEDIVTLLIDEPFEYLDNIFNYMNSRFTEYFKEEIILAKTRFKTNNIEKKDRGKFEPALKLFRQYSLVKDFYDELQINFDKDIDNPLTQFQEQITNIHFQGLFYLFAYFTETHNSYDMAFSFGVADLIEQYEDFYKVMPINYTILFGKYKNRRQEKWDKIRSKRGNPGIGIGTDRIPKSTYTSFRIDANLDDFKTKVEQGKIAEQLQEYPLFEWEINHIIERASYLASEINKHNKSKSR